GLRAQMILRQNGVKQDAKQRASKNAREDDQANCDGREQRRRPNSLSNGFHTILLSCRRATENIRGLGYENDLFQQPSAYCTLEHTPHGRRRPDTVRIEGSPRFTFIAIEVGDRLLCTSLAGPALPHLEIAV